MDKDTVFLTTRQVSAFLNINEKMAYYLIAEKGLPATKITGKWLFPKHLVELWLENHTINYPERTAPLPPYHGLVIISGSNDILLEKTIALFNERHEEHLAVFGNVGSQGGLKALKRGLCHVASSHLLEADKEEYNFQFALEELKGELPAVVNFCQREQGLLVAKGNPQKIKGITDLGRMGMRLANRPQGTGTRLLFDKVLHEAGVEARAIQGYEREFRSHMDVGLEILAGRADAGLAIRPVANLLGLDFLSLRWERYDFLIAKERFFEKGVQLFLGLLHESSFRQIGQGLGGYDLKLSGKMVFPQQSKSQGKDPAPEGPALK